MEQFAAVTQFIETAMEFNGYGGEMFQAKVGGWATLSCSAPVEFVSGAIVETVTPSRRCFHHTATLVDALFGAHHARIMRLPAPGLHTHPCPLSSCPCLAHPPHPSPPAHVDGARGAHRGHDPDHGPSRGVPHLRVPRWGCHHVHGEPGEGACVALDKLCVSHWTPPPTHHELHIYGATLQSLVTWREFVRA
jgi:hypothetical protein